MSLHLAGPASSSPLCSVRDVRRIGSALLVLSFFAVAITHGSAGVTALDGRPVAPLDGSDLVTVLVFTQTECPIANRQAPELERLRRKYEARDVHFWLVYPDPDDDAEAVRRHVAEYGLDCDVLLDPQHDLVQRAGATVTPEAAVFRGGELQYLGRIVDRDVEFGVRRVDDGTVDLDLALAAITRGEAPPESRTPVVGCYIADLRR